MASLTRTRYANPLPRVSDDSASWQQNSMLRIGSCRPATGCVRLLGLPFGRFQLLLALLNEELASPSRARTGDEA